jgi:ACS family hexuronate transporter-like MFS transporter
MIALVFLATVINYLDRQTLSVAAPVLREQFHMSNQGYSRVVFAFLLAYTISNGLSGAVIDRLGTRLGYAICIGVWSVAAMLHALATGPLSLAAFRFLLGIGEAGNWPAGVKVVAEWFPPRERALASGIFNSGSSVGAILAPPLVAWIILHYGWRAAFLLVGVSGIAWLLIWWPSYRMPDSAAGELPGPKVSGWRLFRTRFVWSFTLSKVFLDSVWYFYIFWFPEYLKSARHFSLESIGKFGWIPFMLAGVGNLLGGWVCGILIKRGYSITFARKASVTIFTMLMLSAIPAVLVSDVRLSIALVSVAMAGYTGSLANTLSFPSDVFPKNLVGSVWGLAGMGSGFGGMIFTLITGWVVDHYSYVPVFIGFGILPLICAAVIWSLLGPLERSAGDAALALASPVSSERPAFS